MAGDSKIIQGDALAELRNLPSESVRCIVTSPPYWGLRDYEIEGQIGLEDDIDDYISHLTKVFDEAESVKDRPTRCHEYVFLFSKNEKYLYNREAVTVKNGSGARNRRTVWSINTRPFPEAHFATFPPELVEPCILAGSDEGDTVLDPFFGSGTVGDVCIRNRRRYVGIELNPEYIEIAQIQIRRAEAAARQMELI